MRCVGDNVADARSHTRSVEDRRYSH